MMQIREKQIGGQSSYEIVEEIHHATGVKYRVIVSLGADADPENALFNLLLDGNHSYWIVQSGDAALMQTISASTKSPTIAEKAYLVHNKGG